jgi:hypothetical protein
MCCEAKHKERTAAMQVKSSATAQKPHSDVLIAPGTPFTHNFSLCFKNISSYQDALIFNLHCERFFVSLRPVNLHQANAGQN